MLWPFPYDFGYISLGHPARAFCIFDGCYLLAVISENQVLIDYRSGFDDGL